MFCKQVIIRVDGMKCAHCTNKVQEELKKIDNIKLVKVDLDSKKVTIKYKNEIDLNSVKKLIEDLDYEFLGIED